MALKVLVAARSDVGLAAAQLAEQLGYESVVLDLGADDARAVVSDNAPDVVVVPSDRDPDAALRLIGVLTHEIGCAVVALLEPADRMWLDAAIAAGAFGTLIGLDVVQLEAALQLAARRFDDLRRLQNAFDRRAVIEQAKGLLMAEHGIDSTRAFAMLRQRSQETNSKLVDVARALVRSHFLLTHAYSPTPGLPATGQRTGADDAAMPP